MDPRKSGLGCRAYMIGMPALVTQRSSYGLPAEFTVPDFRGRQPDRRGLIPAYPVPSPRDSRRVSSRRFAPEIKNLGCCDVLIM